MSIADVVAQFMKLPLNLVPSQARLVAVPVRSKWLSVSLYW